MPQNYMNHSNLDLKVANRDFGWLEDMTTEEFIKHVFRWGMQSFSLRPELFKEEMAKAIGQAKYREQLALSRTRQETMADVWNEVADLWQQGRFHTQAIAEKLQELNKESGK